MKEKKAFIFIDVANVWNTQKSVKRFLNYETLGIVIKAVLEKKMEEVINIEKIFYYEAYPKDETRDYDTHKKHKFLTFLNKGLGFTVRKKPIKQIENINNKGIAEVIEKGNMDIELCIDAVHFKNEYDIAVFFTGDADFFNLTKYLNKGGKRCYIFSSKNHVSHELRTGTDGYFDTVDISDLWGKELKYRNQTKK